MIIDGKAILDMRMDDPVPTYTYLVEQLKAHHPGLAYLHTTTVEAPECGRNPEDPAVCTMISVTAPRVADHLHRTHR